MIAVHVRRPPADLTRRQAGLLLDGGITRWSQLGLPGGRLTVTRKASALRSLGPDTVAIVPASKVGPGVRVLSVNGRHPLRDPDDYPIRAAGPEPGRVTTLTVVGDIMLGRRVGERAAARGRPVVPAPADAAAPALRRHHRRQPREHAVHAGSAHAGRRLVRGRPRGAAAGCGRRASTRSAWPTTTRATTASASLVQTVDLLRRPGCGRSARAPTWPRRAGRRWWTRHGVRFGFIGVQRDRRDPRGGSAPAGRELGQHAAAHRPARPRRAGAGPRRRAPLWPTASTW